MIAFDVDRDIRTLDIDHNGGGRSGGFESCGAASRAALTASGFFEPSIESIHQSVSVTGWPVLLPFRETYTSEIRGFYNYYSIANNVSYAASKFGYIMEYSMYHTIAAKTNSSISKVIDKYKKGNDIIVPYHDAKGKLRYRVFYNEGFKRKLPSSFADVDNIPYIITVPQPTLVERLKSEVCELCGKVGPVVMHHARNLNHLKGDTEWEKLMLAKHRKTLVVCTSCNAKIQSHAG